jgi:hypothetical protein
MSARVVLTAAAAAAVAVAVVHLLFGALGADYVVEPPGQPRSEVSFVLAAVIAFVAVAAGGVLAVLLARYAPRRAVPVFLALVVLALLVTAPNPVVAADQTLTVVALEVEHLVAAGVALLLLLPPLRAAAARAAG